MAENKLSSGVGKKIVQALRKQSEIDVQAVTDSIENSKSVIGAAVEGPEVFEEQAPVTDNIELNDDFSDFTTEENEDVFSTVEEPINAGIDNTFSNDFDETFDNMSFDEATSNVFDEQEIFKPAQQVSQPKTYAVPANVAVLKRLIMQLPQGVSKQTGAQIIRQTMEALGISMNSVLKEAQQGQDSITASAKACLATIAEYKNNIRGLEKQVQDYKKQAIALNDLISLFVMTDK